MEISNNILNELKELSPIVAAIQKVNVFTVPNGYFERLEEDILMGVREGGNSLLNPVTTPSPLQVPQGYFDSLADNIFNKIKVGESAAAELKTISPTLYNIQNKNVFTVPQGYFKSLHSVIVNNINKEETAATELKDLSPALYSIRNKNVYTLSGNYFETLSGKILDKIQPQQAKLVTMRKRAATILKYAAAAVFTGVMALGAYKFINTEDKPFPLDYSVIMKTNVDGELATISDEEIVNFLTNDGVDVDAAVAVTQMEDKADAGEMNDNKTESNEIDELLNQLDENKTMN
jgi:hypothetical protein